METGGFVVYRGSGCTLRKQDTSFLKDLAPDTDEIIRLIAFWEVLLDAVD